MTLAPHLSSPETIAQRIILIRGRKVMLDADLAELYGVETKRLNEQVKRNNTRFPADFMFQLSVNEKAEVVANCDHLRFFFFCQLKHKIFRETISVPFYLLIEPLCSYTINICQIGISHHFKLFFFINLILLQPPVNRLPVNPCKLCCL